MVRSSQAIDFRQMVDVGPPPHAIRSPIAGSVHEQWWPFRREDYTGPPDYIKRKGWYPGFERTVYDDHDVAFEFDGEGAEVRVIVSVHVLPKPYKPRIFYIRQWRDPDGKRYGKNDLRMCGEQAFRNWLAGKKVEFLIDARSENSEYEHYNILNPHGEGLGPLVHTETDRDEVRDEHDPHVINLSEGR